jgi:hypothetical protein
MPLRLASWWVLLPCHCMLMLCFVSFWLLIVTICLFQVPLGLPPLLLHCLVTHCRALLFYLMNSYSFPTFLCRWRSLEQHQQVSSTNIVFF